MNANLIKQSYENTVLNRVFTVYKVLSLYEWSLGAFSHELCNMKQHKWTQIKKAPSYSLRDQR